MRIETKKIKVYNYNDLLLPENKELKDNVLNKWRESENLFFWIDESKESLYEFCRIFNLRIKDYSFDLYNCSVYIDYSYFDDSTLELSNIRLLKYIWNNFKDYLFKGKYYSAKSNKELYHNRIRRKKLSNGKIFNSYRSAITLNNSCVLTGYCIDDDILKPVYDFLNKPYNIDLKGLLEKCIESFETSLQKELEYQNSDEYILENIQANEYEFTENGCIY